MTGDRHPGVFLFFVDETYTLYSGYDTLGLSMASRVLSSRYFVLMNDS